MAIAAAAALIITMASPASADLPDDTDVSIEVVGGEINVNLVTFPLGPGDPDPCNPDEDPTVVTATVGPIDGSGVATITDMDFVFPPATVSESTGTCGQIVVTNEPAGTAQMTGDHTADLVIDDPGVVLDVRILDVPFFPDCRLGGITTDLNGAITGHVSGTTGPWAGVLDGDAGFTVPEPTSCGLFAGTVEAGFPNEGPPDNNPGNNLPTTDTDATFELEVTAVP